MSVGFERVEHGTHVDANGPLGIFGELCAGGIGVNLLGDFSEGEDVAVRSGIANECCVAETLWQFIVTAVD